MINHARTLLLNRSGASRPAQTYYLEEYVDPAFLPIKLPTYLSTVRDALVGGNSDNAYANFRLREIFRTIDSTEYRDYITALDPRVTYRRDRSVVQVGKSLTAAPITSGTTLELVFVGEITQGPLTQQLQYDWVVEQLTSTSVKITSAQLGQSADTTFSYTNGISSLIPLVGQNDLFFRFIQGGSSFDGSQWAVEGFTEPDEDFHSIMAPLSKLGDAALFLLFPNRDPYILFKNLFQNSIFFQDNLTGIALAYAYGANEVRLNV